MTLQITQTSFATIEKSWRELEKYSATASFFQTYDFHRVFLKHFPQQSLTILGVYDRNELVGIAPLVKKNDTFMFIVTQNVSGDELVADYGDIISHEGKEQEVWDVLIHYVKDNHCTLHLDFVRESSPTFQELIADSRQLKAELNDIAPFSHLPDTWDTYLSHLSRKNRHELRRKIRKSTQEGVQFIFSENVNTTTIAEFFSLMSVSSEHKAAFLTDRMKQFFAQLMIELSQKHTLHLSLLRYNNHAIAATITFEHNGHMLLYNSGFDPEYKALSPGVVLVGWLLQHAIEKKYRVFDFLRGDEKYKYNFGGIDQKLHRFTVSSAA